MVGIKEVHIYSGTTRRMLMSLQKSMGESTF